MATSGSVTYSMTEMDIITDALEEIGAKSPYEPVQAEDIEICRRKLNLILKQWNGNTDYAPGLKMWTRRTGYVFLQKGQVQYSIGPSGDNATESYVSTSLSVSASTSDGTVTVASATGLSTGMYIGILMDSGSFHWTTINGAPSGNVVTLTAAMAGAASAGATVYSYATKMRRPFEILTCVRRDTESEDWPIGINLLVDDYEAIANKTEEGTPSQLYFEAQRTNSVIYIDRAPEDAREVLRIRYSSYIEDFTSQTESPDLPSEWFRPICAQLAVDISPAYSKPVSAELRAKLNESLTIARRAYPMVTTAEYQNNPDEY